MCHRRGMIRRNVNGVVLYQFESLVGYPRLRHAVSTRLGGVSTPPFASLNLTMVGGDDPGRVDENHRRLCTAVGISPSDLVSPQQVHRDQVVRVGREDRGRVVPGCDGLITDEPGVALLLRFADCVPLIVYDPVHHAVGVAHAGWRGTVRGIATALVSAMQREFHSRPEELIAGIGPSIGPCCYEVGLDVVQLVRATLDTSNGVVSRWPNGAYHLDLWAANDKLLTQAGVRHIEVAGLCTACHTDEFYSHRAERGRTGRHGALAYLT
ncbi:MAG: peptidoglycan editing factor PgeF [Anaerolineae bacterium]|nr:peptidoglycan editing factor PgeF [Anaerolineae bacterium]